ncbi:MAG: protein kinase [Deltaproteobacteria bacterium]|nr:protein kinase [Deltaproteobacteria bacterium]
MTRAFPVQFGRYLLVDKIASGGMAEIFRAKLVGVEGFEKNVVIKRIHPFWSERRDFITMLVDEAKLLVHLNHPNIVQVYELGREGETYFIAMEFVEGVDLRQLQNRLKTLGLRMPPEIAAAVCLESLKGLHYAHERSLKERGRLGIVHRDVSPQNILLSFEGEVKVTDFGIAKAMTQTHETQTGVLKGKYAYMSPEQAVGAPLDARSDLFACGIVLYELLFERRLFAGKNDLETLENVRRAQVPWPEAEGQALFPGLRQLLVKALQARPEDRFATAEEFTEALEACVPKERRVGRRGLAAFLEEVFAEEIRDRRRQGEEIRQKTESFLRQTQAGPLAEEETVSLVEAPTELEARPASPTASTSERPPSFRGEAAGRSDREAPFANSAKARPRILRPKVAALALVAFAGIAYTAWRYWPREGGEGAVVSGGAQVVATVSAPSQPSVPGVALAPASEQAPAAAIAESRPSLAPSATAPPTAGPLLFRATPNSAQLRARYPGGEQSGVGTLRLEGLAAGTPVQISASLASYESQTKSLQVSQDPSPQEHVIKLEKKAPAFGGLRVNAVPWGRVTVPGLIGGSETPVVRGKVPEGKYAVSVSNSAMGKTLRATAVIRGGKTTRCHADFEGRGALSCR